MVLPICHAGMDPKKGGTPDSILLQSWRKGGLRPSPPFSGVSQSKMIDPGQVERGDGPEAGEHQVDEEQQADGSCGSQGGG